MKRMIKHFSLLITVAVLFAVLTVSAWASGNEDDKSFDMSLVFTPETRLVVYVDDEWSDALSDSYDMGDTAELTVPAKSGEKSFSHWEADGSVISYDNPLTLTMNAHTTLYAVWC